MNDPKLNRPHDLRESFVSEAIPIPNRNPNALHLTPEERHRVQEVLHAHAGCADPDCKPETCSVRLKGRAVLKLLHIHDDDQRHEREWAAMREDRDQFQREAAKLKQENREAERYAGAMEAALESIRYLCRLARGLGPSPDRELHELLDVITRLATVRDHRGGTPEEHALRRRAEACEAELRETAAELEVLRANVKAPEPSAESGK